MKKLIGLILWAFLLCPQLALAQPNTICYTTNGVNCVPAVQAASSIAINGLAAGGPTQIVAASTGKWIYITSFDFVSTAAATVQLVYGTGTNCATGTTNLTGAYGMSTFTVITKGNGLSGVLFVPSGNALCITVTGTGPVNGSLSYAQF